MFGTGKVSYSEWRGMDLAEYYEAREAYIDYMDNIRQIKGGG